MFAVSAGRNCFSYLTDPELLPGWSSSLIQLSLEQALEWLHRRLHDWPEAKVETITPQPHASWLRLALATIHTISKHEVTTRAEESSARWPMPICSSSTETVQKCKQNGHITLPGLFQSVASHVLTFFGLFAGSLP
jgi:hypothetical protein